MEVISMGLHDILEKELETLIKESDEFFPMGSFLKYYKNLETDPKTKKRIELKSDNYQVWYTKSLTVIQQIIPERVSEFQDLYRLPKR